ncbi:MAG TPA: PEP-CTERM sorting domain-containing protein [Bryobacteraceae bacterium]|nr:PEP-CTERM sorting domain-containing protein [Bryobacteraceae bacterium]
MTRCASLLAFGLLALSMHAGTIVQNTGGGGLVGPEFVGQPFTTPSGGPWVNIKFNFYQDSGTVAAAKGTAYIFTSAYTGTPSGLSGSSFLAAGPAIFGVSYNFAPSFMLQPNTQYFLYEDAALLLGVGSTGNRSNGGSPSLPFSPLCCGATNFLVAGDPVPESSTGLLVGVALAGFALTTLRKRRVNTLRADHR